MRDEFVSDLDAEYHAVIEAHERAARRTGRGCRWLKLARNALDFVFDESRWWRPPFTGVRTIDDVDLAELVDYIDWTPFFWTWSLRGQFPAILDDAELGEAARPLFDDAQRMLEQIVDEQLVRAEGGRRVLAGPPRR